MDNMERKRFAEGEEPTCKAAEIAGPHSNLAEDAANRTAMEFHCLFPSVQNESLQNRGGSASLEPAMDTQNFQPRSLRRSKIMKI